MSSLIEILYSVKYSRKGDCYLMSSDGSFFRSPFVEFPDFTCSSPPCSVLTVEALASVVSVTAPVPAAVMTFAPMASVEEDWVGFTILGGSMFPLPDPLNVWARMGGPPIGVVPVGSCQSCEENIVFGDWKSTYLEGNAEISPDRLGNSMILTPVLLIGMGLLLTP